MSRPSGGRDRRRTGSVSRNPPPFDTHMLTMSAVGLDHCARRATDLPDTGTLGSGTYEVAARTLHRFPTARV